jgi:hypothetical protein
MEQTVLPEHLLNKQAYSDTNSVKAPLPWRFQGPGENVAATCTAWINDTFLTGCPIIAVQ